MSAADAPPPSPGERLRALMARGTVVAPFVFDGVQAKLAEAAGFDAVYMSGFGTAGGVSTQLPEPPTSEFEKSFDVFRNRKFKGALSAEFRFRETASQLYDLVTIYGMSTDVALKSMLSGYQAIVGNMPELSVEGAS